MEDLGHQIKRIDRLFKLRMDRNLEKSGLTNSQMHVLMYLFVLPKKTGKTVSWKSIIIQKQKQRKR